MGSVMKLTIKNSSNQDLNIIYWGGGFTQNGKGSFDGTLSPGDSKWVQFEKDDRLSGGGVTASGNSNFRLIMAHDYVTGDGPVKTTYPAAYIGEIDCHCAVWGDWGYSFHTIAMKDPIPAFTLNGSWTGSNPLKATITVTGG